MKTLLILSLTCIVAFNFSTAQQVTFQKSFSSGGFTIGRGVRQTTDGGYVFTGYTEVLGAGITDMYLVKTDAGGDTLWTKTYGGSQYEEGFCVEQTTDGGYIIAGYTGSFGAGQEDVYLVKTDAMGDTLWTKAYGGPYMDRAASVIETSDGGYIISGETTSFGAGNHDIYVVRTNSSGDLLWTKSMGTNGDNYGHDVIETADNRFMISGNHGGFGAYIVMLNAEGDSLWSKGYVPQGPPHLSYAYAIRQTPDTGFVFVGVTLGFSAIASYVQKTDSIGNPEWAKTFGASNNTYTNEIGLTTDGGYILSGWAQGFPSGSYKNLLIRIDEAGDTIWTRQYIGGNSYSSVQQTTDGGFILLASDNFHIYLIKTDAHGNTGCTEFNAWPEITDWDVIAADPIAFSGVGGTMSNTNSILHSGGTLETLCFVCDIDVGFNPLPDTVCLFTPEFSLVGNPSGGIFTEGGVIIEYFNPAFAGAGLHELVYTYTYASQCFASDTVWVFVDECTGIEEVRTNPSFGVFPNPAQEYLMLTIDPSFSGSTSMCMLDVAGRKIYTTGITSSNFKLDTRLIADGIYFCCITNGVETEVKKIVIRH